MRTISHPYAARDAGEERRPRHLRFEDAVRGGVGGDISLSYLRRKFDAIAATWDAEQDPASRRAPELFDSYVLTLDIAYFVQSPVERDVSVAQRVW
jgi:hypothetical protein